MEINLYAEAERKIIELTMECKIGRSINMVLCLFIVVCLPLILLGWTSVMKKIEDIKQQHERQGAILEKVHGEGKRGQKKSCWV